MSLTGVFGKRNYDDLHIYNWIEQNSRSNQ